MTTRRHGHRGGADGKRSPTYFSWAAMKQRCLNPKHQHYKDYGGRGITICPEWLKFSAFLADMGERPLGLTLERLDHDGPYCKENCCWASNSVQNKNRRPWPWRKNAATGRFIGSEDQEDLDDGSGYGTCQGDTSFDV